MEDLNKILLNFDTRKRLTEGAAYPLVAYAVINYISANELYEYFKDNSLKVSLSSVQNWRRNAAQLLGLSQEKAGRVSFAKQKKLRKEWHQINGHPTIQMLMDGWMPNQKKVVVEQHPQPSINQPTSPVQEVLEEVKNDKSETEEKVASTAKKVKPVLQKIEAQKSNQPAKKSPKRTQRKIGSFITKNKRENE